MALFGQAPLKRPLAPKRPLEVPVVICGAKAKAVFHGNRGPHPERIQNLFDEDPRTVFEFPTTGPESFPKSYSIEIVFEEPQVLEGVAILPGWQKSLKTFDASQKPGLLSLSTEQPSAGDSITGGIPIIYPDGTAHHGKGKWADRDIWRPGATFRNMRERLHLFESPWEIKNLFIAFTAFEYQAMDNIPIAQTLKDWRRNPPYFHISELVLLLSNRPTALPIRNSVVKFLGQLRDHAYEKMNVLNPPECLPDLRVHQGGGPNRLSRSWDEYFGSSNTSCFYSYKDGQTFLTTSDHPYFRNYFKYYWCSFINTEVEINYLGFYRGLRDGHGYEPENIRKTETAIIVPYRFPPFLYMIEPYLKIGSDALLIKAGIDESDL